jgi:hypothetical protein
VLMGKKPLYIFNIVRQKSSGIMYAMKVIKKKHIMDQDKVE